MSHSPRAHPDSPFLQSQYLQRDVTLAITSETTPLLTFAPSFPVPTVKHEPLPVHPEPGESVLLYQNRV